MEQKEYTINQLLEEAESLFKETTNIIAGQDIDEGDYDTEEEYNEAVEDELYSLNCANMYTNILNSIKDRLNLDNLIVEQFEQGIGYTYIAKYQGNLICCCDYVDYVEGEGEDAYAHAEIWVEDEYEDEDYIDACKEISHTNDPEEALEIVNKSIAEIKEYCE